MKEFIDKLIGRLEELKDTDVCSYSACTHEDCADCVQFSIPQRAIEIVNELAEEFATDINVVSNNGWIPCSERLPSFDGAFICTAKEVEESLELIYSSFDNSWMDEFDGEYEVIAWMPLPQPYKEESTSSAEWKQHILNRFEGGDSR